MGFKSAHATQPAPGDVFTPSDGLVSLGESSNHDSNLVRSIEVPDNSSTWVDTTVKSVSKTLYQAKDKLDSAGEMLNQAKEKLNSTYEHLSHNMSDSVDKAAKYGRDNPGKTGLILFGTGVGIGVLIVTLWNKRR